MDLDFDNTPEVILAYNGGSMGNLPLEIYDLNTGEKLGSYYSFSRYGEKDNVYLCVAQKGDEYVIIEKSSIRITDADYVQSVGTVKADRNSESDYLQVSPLFSIGNEGDIITYKYMGQTVEKAEYDALYQQFLTDCVVIEETQLQLIKWESFGKLEWKDFGYKEGIDPESHRKLAKKMADALINSSQQFIKYDISDNAETNEELTDSQETESTEANNTETETETETAYDIIPAEYTAILDAYVKMATYKNETNSIEGINSWDYPELSQENFVSLRTHTKKYNSYGMGYFLYDINLDGIQELIFSHWGGGSLSPYCIYMIFTLNENKAQLIGSFEDTELSSDPRDVQLGDDGKIHCFDMSGHYYSDCSYIHSIISFDKTGITESFSYKITYYYDGDGYENGWFKEANGEWVSISEDEYLKIEEEYHFTEVNKKFDYTYFFEFAPK